MSLSRAAILDVTKSNHLWASDDYRLPSSESAALKLMGDAVAVPVVRALTEGLLLPALTAHRAAA